MKIEGNINDGDSVLKLLLGNEGEVVSLAGDSFVIASFVVDAKMNYTAELLSTIESVTIVPANQTGGIELDTNEEQKEIPNAN